jgi:hypothetical protein
MPAWEPCRAELSSNPETVRPAEALPSADGQRVRNSAAAKARDLTRRVADPFHADDDGANCLRCGYLVEPARERRGLNTCAACG